MGQRCILQRALSRLVMLVLANGVLSLSNGALASYTISFGASVLQGTQRAPANTARLQNSDSNGILVAPSSCMMGTAGSGNPQECILSYTMSLYA